MGVSLVWEARLWNTLAKDVFSAMKYFATGGNLGGSFGGVPTKSAPNFFVTGGQKIWRGTR